MKNNAPKITETHTLKNGVGKYSVNVQKMMIKKNDLGFFITININDNPEVVFELDEDQRRYLIELLGGAGDKDHEQNIA